MEALLVDRGRPRTVEYRLYTDCNMHMVAYNEGLDGIFIIIIITISLFYIYISIMSC